MESVFSLGMYFKKIHHVMESKANKEFSKLELTRSQVEVLIFLFENKDKEINQKDIEKRFNLTNPTVTGILSRLEIKGFITRSISLLDARYRKIELTTKTLEMKNAVSNKMKLAEKNVLENMTEEEIKTLKILLDKFLNYISEV